MSDQEQYEIPVQSPELALQVLDLMENFKPTFVRIAWLDVPPTVALVTSRVRFTRRKLRQPSIVSYEVDIVYEDGTRDISIDSKQITEILGQVNFPE